MKKEELRETISPHSPYIFKGEYCPTQEKEGAHHWIIDSSRKGSIFCLDCFSELYLPRTLDDLKKNILLGIKKRRPDEYDRFKSYFDEYPFVSIAKKRCKGPCDWSDPDENQVMTCQDCGHIGDMNSWDERVLKSVRDAQHKRKVGPWLANWFEKYDKVVGIIRARRKREKHLKKQEKS